MINRQAIFIASYPKSGSTWLTRLLGDVLNSPTGGCMSSEDKNEVATEGLDRPGPYVVRKGHFVLTNWRDDGGPVVPKPHCLAWKQLTTESVVFLVRDPRDICISGAWHWRITPAEFLDRMIKGNVAKCGRWDKYVDRWLRINQYVIDTYGVVVEAIDKNLVNTRYEDLLEMPNTQIGIIIQNLGLDFELYTERYHNAIKRQSFASRKAQIGSDEKELRRNNMRKGVAGDWHNHFTTEMNDKIWHEFGWIMERLGYDYG